MATLVHNIGCCFRVDITRAVFFLPFDY